MEAMRFQSSFSSTYFSQVRTEFWVKLQVVSYTPERKKRLAPENGGPLTEKEDSKTWKPTIFLLEVYAFFFFSGSTLWLLISAVVGTKNLIITSSTQPCLSKISEATRYSLALGVTQVHAGGPLDDAGDWTIWDDYSTIIC